MKRELSFYEKFLKLKELIVGLPFEVSMDEKMEAFYSLVDLLLKKGVYKNDGSIQKWRVNSIQYLREVVDLLDEDNLQQILVDQELFFERFIFTPCGKNTSIYATFKKKCGANMEFNGIPLYLLFDHFTERTGKSAYEKVPRYVAQNFLLEVENFR